MGNRSKFRVGRIDSFLKENYSKFGASYCAEYLEEPIKYIRGRVGILKLTMDSGYKRKSGNKNKIQEIPLSKSTNTFNGKIKSLQEIILDLKEINRELRLENIIIIHDNMNLRKSL